MGGLLVRCRPIRQVHPQRQPSLQAQARRTLTCAQDTSRQKKECRRRLPTGNRTPVSVYVAGLSRIGDEGQEGVVPRNTEYFLPLPSCPDWIWKSWKSSTGNLPASCTSVLQLASHSHTTHTQAQGSTTKTVLSIGFCLALSSCCCISVQTNPNQYPVARLNFDPASRRNQLSIPPSTLLPSPTHTSSTTSQQLNLNPHTYPISTSTHGGTSNGRAQRRNRACRERHQPWCVIPPCPFMSQS